METLKPELQPLSATDGLDRLGLIDATASWCECLQGRQSLMAALQQLAEGLGARAACLARVSRGPGNTARTVIYNASAWHRPTEKVTRSFAACVLGRYVGHPRPASVWLSSMVEDGSDPALAVFQKRARLAEAAVVTLTVDSKWVDFLEIHFAQALDSRTVSLLNMVAGTLSRTWANRSAGLFSDAVLTSRTGAKLGFQEPLLNTSNPARLSRAEFRVCLLLSRGLNTAAVCGELGISPSTLKAHLRSIFAKTETASLAELLFQLLRPFSEPRYTDLPVARQA